MFQLDGRVMMSELAELNREFDQMHLRLQEILRFLKKKIQESADEEKSECLSTNGSSLCHMM